MGLTRTSHQTDLVWTCLNQLYNYPFNLDFGMTNKPKWWAITTFQTF